MHPETDPIFSSYVLGTVADYQDLLWRLHLHEVYIPVAAVSVVHAVRISHGTRMLSGGGNSRLGLFQGLVLNLIVLFGSSCVIAVMLGMPFPLLMSPFAICLYSSVYIIMHITGLGDGLVRLHEQAPRRVDLATACIDAMCRIEGIVNVRLAQIQGHPNPVIAQSWFVQIIAGALVSGGVPLIAQTFQLHSPMGLWQMTTPAWIQQPSRLLYADLVGGAVVSFLMLVLTSGQIDAKMPWLPRPTPALARWLSLAHKPDMHRVPHLPYFSLREAKAICAVVLLICLVFPILRRRSLPVSKKVKT